MHNSYRFNLCFCSPSVSNFFVRFVDYLHISTDIKNIRSLGTWLTVQHSTVA